MAFDQVFQRLGVPATLSIGTSDYELTMIDATSGQMVGFQGVDVATIGPSAYVRMSELAENGIALADLDNAELALSGKDWRVVSHEERPAIGEIRLALETVNV